MLAPSQLAQLEEDGFLVLPSLLDDEHIDPVVREYEQALDAAANRLLEMGRIGDPHAGVSFAERYTELIVEDPSVFYYLGISIPLDYEGLDPEFVTCHAGPALFGLLRNEKILDVVESVLGGEIASNPVQQVRLKPPQRLLTGATAEYSNVGATTWHQDFAALMDEARDTEMLTVWVAVTDIADDMGCLAVMPGSHRDRQLTPHCPGVMNAAENYIPQSLLDRHGVEPLPLPCPKGSVILLTRFTEHGALPNESNRLRWSFDLRYQRSGEPTGRPAFPSFVLRSRAHPATAVTDPAAYSAGWERARSRVLAGDVAGPVYEQGRWLVNRDAPICA